MQHYHKEKHTSNNYKNYQYLHKLNSRKPHILLKIIVTYTLLPPNI